MTEYASVEELTAPRADTGSGMPEGDVTLASGAIIRVRGMSRWEAMKGKAVDDRIEWEAYVIATGMVAPAMTVEAVRTWQQRSLPAELEPVTDKIAELSGMDEGAERRAVREMVENPEAEFRVLPSGSTEDDGRPAQDDAAG